MGQGVIEVEKEIMSLTSKDDFTDIFIGPAPLRATASSLSAGSPSVGYYLRQQKGCQQKCGR
jgi:hypothetical protein